MLMSDWAWVLISAPPDLLMGAPAQQPFLFYAETLPPPAPPRSLTLTQDTGASINLCTNQLWKRGEIGGFLGRSLGWGCNREEAGPGRTWNIKPAILSEKGIFPPLPVFTEGVAVLQGGLF